MILNTTTKKVQILLGGTIATNQSSVVVDYVDFTSTTTTPGNQFSNTNSTTAVDIVNAPATSTQRKVNLITVCNKDTNYIYVTIRLNDNGTTYNYVASVLVPPSGTLQFTDTDGWKIINQDGSISNSAASSAFAVDIQVFDAGGSSTWTKPTSATYVLVDLIGGGAGSIGNGYSAYFPSNYSTYAGGGGGSRIQHIFLANTLPLTCSVLVPAVSGFDGGNTVFGAGIGNVFPPLGFNIGNYGIPTPSRGLLVAYGGRYAGGGGGGTGQTAWTIGYGGGPAGALSAGSSTYSDYRGGDVSSGSYWGGGGGGTGGSPGTPGSPGDCYNGPSPGTPGTPSGPGGASFFGGGGGGGLNQQGGISGGSATSSTGGISGAASAGNSIKAGSGGAYSANGATPGGGAGGNGKYGGAGRAWIISW